MEISIQDLIEAEECSEITINKRDQTIKRALNRYKLGKLIPDEREILVDAMQNYKRLAFKEEQARAYNVLLYYYFSSRPLIPKQIMRLFNIDRRTVFKDIDRGIKDLTVILYGVGGVDLLPEEESPASIKTKIQESITKRLTDELGEEVRNECRAFITEKH